MAVVERVVVIIFGGEKKKENFHRVESSLEIFLLKSFRSKFEAKLFLILISWNSLYEEIVIKYFCSWRSSKKLLFYILIDKIQYLS